VSLYEVVELLAQVRRANTDGKYLTEEKQMTIAEKLIEEWNANNPIGTPVLVRRDNGDIERSCTRSIAWMLGGHTPVVQVDGVVGCYALERVSAIQDPVAAKADFLQKRLDELVAWLKEQLKKTGVPHRVHAFNEVLKFLGQVPIAGSWPADAPVSQGYRLEVADGSAGTGITGVTADMLSRGCVNDSQLCLVAMNQSTCWAGNFNGKDIFVSYRFGNVCVQVDGVTKIEFHDEDFATMQTTLQALLRVQLCSPKMVVMWSKGSEDIKWKESR